ncbi:DUF5675 family protein [Aquiflexum sp.]|uniref:DUF5675 family protein n=1 Tax=Aquiflexum sp. TaxID=1872584 RepID=UPI003593CDF4
MKFHLEREYWPGGTNGTITIEGYKICHTIELSWKRNNSGSCIPEGTYTLRKEFSEEWGWHILLLDAQGWGNIPILPQKDKMCKLPVIVPVVSLIGEGRGSYAKTAFEKFKEIVCNALESEEQILLEIKSYPDAALNLAQYEMSWMD